MQLAIKFSDSDYKQFLHHYPLKDLLLNKYFDVFIENYEVDCLILIIRDTYFMNEE